MKDRYLYSLRKVLEENRAFARDIEDIISDYDQLYEDALASGKTDDEVWHILGDPKEVVQELIESMQLKKEKNIKTKIVATMPFISLIIFFLLGFVEGLWHPGWLVFLLIPISAILFESKLKDGIVGVTPFVSVIIYLILGWGYGLWHPGWLVFFSIPVVAIIVNVDIRDIPVALSPFVATIIFIVLGTYYQLWNLGWLVFLIIPMLGTLKHQNKVQLVLIELSYILAIIFYLYMGYTYSAWYYGAIGFILPLTLSIVFGVIKIAINLRNDKKARILLSIILATIILFFVLGFTVNGWVWAWQVLLVIPMAGIIIYDKVRLTALMPFISVILFFSIGYFFTLFHLS